MFDFLKKKKEIKGELGYYGLGQWWLETFTDSEKKFILNKYDPLGGSSEGLIEGDIEFVSGSASNMLTGIAGWFTSDAPGITDKFMDKAAEVIENETVLDKHFYYHCIFTYYKGNTDKYDIVRKALENQILLSAEAKEGFLEEYPGQELPSHTGYDEMFKVLVDELKNKEAIELAKHAKAEGWKGDWDKKITKLRQNEIGRNK